MFGSHHGESLSSLLVKVTMTPPLSLRQAITSSPRAAAVAMKTPAATRMAGAHGGGSNGGGTNNQQSTKSTETATMTPTTSFVELYLIYYYYLFIYHYIDCDVALLRCRYRQSIRAAATALPPSRCAPPPRFALPPPPIGVSGSVIRVFFRQRF